MTHITEAIYDDGVLKPVEVLNLADQQRVRIIIQSIDGRGHDDRAAAVQRLRDGVKQMNFQSRGALPTRDELHDRL